MSSLKSSGFIVYALCGTQLQLLKNYYNNCVKLPRQEIYATYRKLCTFTALPKVMLLMSSRAREGHGFYLLRHSFLPPVCICLKILILEKYIYYLTLWERVKIISLVLTHAVEPLKYYIFMSHILSLEKLKIHINF